MSTKHLILLITVLMAIVQLLFVLDSGFTTYMYASVSYISLFLCMVLNSRIRKRMPLAPKLILLGYGLLCGTAIIRGFGEAANYWDWKEFLLNNVFIMLFPIISVMGSNMEVSRMFLRCYLVLLPLGVIVYILSRFSENTDGFGRYMSPVCFFILMIPYLKKKYVIAIIVMALISFFSDMEARSNMVRIIVVFIICFFSLFYRYISPVLRKVVYVTIFLVPFLFFAMGYLGVFNVFAMDDYSGMELSVAGKDAEDADLLADTRTFIYKEQLGSLVNRGRLLFGESASAGYESVSFQESSLTSKGRASSEVGILNVVMYNGLFGGFLFSLLFFLSGYHCLRFARNKFAISLSFFIAFRWLYSWVEEFTNYDLSYFFLWLMLGLCLSREMASLDDAEMGIWLRQIVLPNYQNKNT